MIEGKDDVEGKLYKRYRIKRRAITAIDEVL